MALLFSPASVETPSPSKSPLLVVHAPGWAAGWVGKGSYHQQDTTYTMIHVNVYMHIQRMPNAYLFVGYKVVFDKLVSLYADIAHSLCRGYTVHVRVRHTCTMPHKCT